MIRQPNLEVVGQVLILLPTDSILMQWRGPYTVESHMGANDYQVKMGSKTKTYLVNMLNKYIARELEVDVVHTSNNDDAATAVEPEWFTKILTQSGGKYQP